MKKENSFEKTFMKKIKMLPNTYFPDKGAAGSVIGNADRVGCIRGRYISLEFKRSLKDALKKTPRSKLQLYNAEKVQMAGGFAAFVHPDNDSLVFKQLKDLAHE
jgi:hypothetical protein